MKNKNNILSWRIIRGKYRILVLLILSLMIIPELQAQEIPTRFSGEFVEYVLQYPEMDTLVLHRKPGDWWYGVIGGANINMSYSDLNMPFVPGEILDENNPLISFPGEMGSGVFLGITGDWLPVDSDWGASVNIFFLDTRNNAPISDVLKDYPDLNPEEEEDPDELKQDNKQLEALVYHNYITISPSARYNLPFRGMYLNAGFDCQILTGSEIKHRFKYENSGAIDQDRFINESSVPLRFAFHFGVGYDMFVADFNHEMRLYFSPYITLNTGSALFDAYGSSRNDFVTRVGLAVKFCPDIITEEKRLYDPTYVEPVEFIASAKFERPIDFPGFENESLVGEELAYVPFRSGDTLNNNEASLESSDIASSDTKDTTVEKPVDIASTDTVRDTTAEKPVDIASTDTVSDTTTEKPVDIASTDTTTTTTTTTVTPDIASADTVKKDTTPVVADVPDKPDKPEPTFNPTRRRMTFNTRLGSSQRKWLDQMADYMKTNPGVRLSIVGHADNTGTPEAQERRAARRATAVVRYLQGKGVNRRRLLDNNNGARSPVATNSTASGRSKNRRVEIRVVR